MPEDFGNSGLIAQIRAGDAGAWRAFIDAYEGRLAAFVRPRLHDSAAADDVVQEAFVGFLVSLPNFDPSRDLETYLFTIAAHKLTDHLRRVGRRPVLPLSVGDESGAAEREPADSARSAGSLAASGERRGLEASALAEALAELLGRLRTRREFVKLACLELLFVRGRTNKEAAALLAIGEQTVANYKFEFLEKLRVSLQSRKLPPELWPTIIV